MLKNLLGFTLIASIACAGVAQAQSITTPPLPSVTITTKPGTPALPPTAGTIEHTLGQMPIGEFAAIGVGAVVGIVLFDEAAWNGLVVVGAALGGWAGDFLYRATSVSWHST
jgi:hypothetical protein